MNIELLKKSLEPYPRLTPSDWCEANITLPQSVTNKPGPLLLQPWFKPIIDELDNPETEEITIASAAQVGKTTLEICAMSYGLAVWDSPTLLVFPTESEAEATVVTRLIADVRTVALVCPPPA